uniref:Uncharacterized protein n=1 Tax=Solanum tuberosum TaxID=4113 RepID=M1D9N1_SOLTU
MEKIDIVGVIAKLNELFKGRPSLILEFNASVPNVYDKIPNDEDQAPLKKTTYKEQILKRYDSRIDVVDALSNVTKVWEKISNQMEKYEMFIDIMKHFKAQSNEGDEQGKDIIRQKRVKKLKKSKVDALQRHSASHRVVF